MHPTTQSSCSALHGPTAPRNPHHSALFALVLGLVLGLCATSLQAQRRPNVVLVLADDMGYYSLGAFGQQKIKTPNLDTLARQGMRFTRFYANQMCSPTRGSLLTGMHTGHGLVRGNYELGGYADELEFGQMPLPANIQTMGTELQRAGYATAVMGKWGVGGPQSTGMPNLQGVDLFYGYLDQKQAHNYYPTHLWRNDTREPLPNAWFSAHPTNIDIKAPNDPASYAAYKGTAYSADLIHQEAMKFIAQHKQKPFFLEMAYTLPHMSLQVPDRALAQYKGQFDDHPYLGKQGYLPNQYPRATYAAMISLLDEYVGDLMRVLAQNGLQTNTLVLFTADNGAAVAGGCDADYFKCSGELRGRKGSIYEGGIKVPFIAWWPGVVQPGSTSDHLSGIWDLMPTFLEAAGETPIRTIDGLSFLPTLKQQGAQKEHEFLYWERHSADGNSHTQAVRFGDWKAVKTTQTDGAHLALFNLKTDESEKHNVAAQHSDLVRQAEGYLQTRRLAVISEWNFAKPTEER
jgi:arylsulfatase A